MNRRFGVMNLRAFMLLAAGCTAFGTAWAAPAVTGVSGTVGHGQTLTVSGSGFGSHANHNAGTQWNGAAHLNFRFKDFEDGAINSAGFYGQKGGSNWSPASSELGIFSGGPTNSSKYLSRKYQTGESGGLSTNVQGAGNQLYTTFKLMMAPNTQSGKFWRMYADSPQNNIYLSSGCSGYKVRGYSECSAGSCSGAATDWGSGPDMTPGQWHRVEIWADAPSHTFTVSVNGVVAMTKTNWLNTSLLLNGHTLDYPNMIDSSSRSASCPAVGAYNFDDIFIDFTRARVELGDAATWSATRKKEVQLPTSWASGSISVKVNTGTFSQGQTAYLYVVDASGAVNAQGLPVTIGGGAQATVKPEPPTDVNVQ